MSWVEHHKCSERFASKAQVALLSGSKAEALRLYAKAADAERRALADLDESKIRTVGISAVSAASLYYKAENLECAEEVAVKWLGWRTLPAFAKAQLDSLRRSIQRDQTPTSEESPPKTTSYICRIPGKRLVNRSSERDILMDRYRGSQRQFEVSVGAYDLANILKESTPLQLMSHSRAA